MVWEAYSAHARTRLLGFLALDCVGKIVSIF